jgi:hypothetical protein
MLPHTQLSESNTVNTASLITVVDNLYRQNFLTEATYQKVRRLTELGGIQKRSRLLRYVVEDWDRRGLGGSVAKTGTERIIGGLNFLGLEPDGISQSV